MSANWETFCDESYYHMWRIRRTNQRGFDDGFHAANGEDARAIVELLNTLERQRSMLTRTMEAATVLIAAKGRHNTMLAYEGLREALEAMKGVEP